MVKVKKIKKTRKSYLKNKKSSSKPKTSKKSSKGGSNVFSKPVHHEGYHEHLRKMERDVEKHEKYRKHHHPETIEFLSEEEIKKSLPSCGDCQTYYKDKRSGKEHNREIERQCAPLPSECKTPKSSCSIM